MESKYAVECQTCGKLKPSIDPNTEYCCGKQMQIMEETI